ncbi:type II toxin-antitoxin system RelE/ParE family toxin [Candidatus Peregrinibacteria bacterium]|nr:type II toxin-antitoxin system RelE/ParE family toxin [Candidatus Peregrinibacteria bacterium]
MSYKVIYTKDAIKDLKKLDQSIAHRIIKKIDFWTQQKDPLHFAKPLRGLVPARYRFRVGDYRIIFSIGEKGEFFVLFILMIKHRREIYRV